MVMHNYASETGSELRIQCCAVRVKSLTADAERFVQFGANCMIAAGRELILAKSQVAHGRWGEWLKAECGMSERTARRYMQAAARFKTVAVADLSVAVLQELLSKDVRDSAIDEVRNRAKQGEKITKKKARAIVSSHGDAKPSGPVNRISEALAEVDKAAANQPSPAPAVATLPAAPAEHQLRGMLSKLGELTTEELLKVREECDRLLGVQATPEPVATQTPRPVKIQLAKGTMLEFDPCDMKVPEKFEGPRFRSAWCEWVNYNAEEAHPLTESVATKQMKELGQRSLDAAIRAIDKAISTRAKSFPAAKETRPAFVAPTVADVEQYVEQSGFKNVEPDRFVSYYEQQNWKLSNGNAMSDWKAAVRHWDGRKKEEKSSKPKGAAAVDGAYEKYVPHERVMPSVRKSAPVPSRTAG